MRIKRNKWKTILSLCAVLLILAGFSFTTPLVELYDDTPMIDLEAAIQEAPYGQSGYESHEEGEDPDLSTENEEQGKIITIRVRGEEVRLEKDKIFDLSPLGNRIRGKYKTGDEVYLIDDYADSARYKEVKTILEKLNSEYGIRYSEH